MKSLLSLFITISLLLPLGSISAEKSTEIYKWTDKDGRVHYAASPGDKNAKKMHLGSHRFKTTDTNKDKLDKEAKERAATCKASKGTLAKYNKAPFLYRYDEEKKQKVRLSKAESEEVILQAKKDISYWCDEPEKEKAEKNKDAANKDAEISQNNSEK
jgi:hypothetical protein